MTFGQPTYSFVCPKCGGSLQPVALDPQTAPWLCTPCGLGFFTCELSNDARAAYDHLTLSWGNPIVRSALDVGRAAEVAGAHGRGTSLRDDQVTVTSLSVLKEISTRNGVDPAFQALVHQHVINSGGH